MRLPILALASAVTCAAFTVAAAPVFADTTLSTKSSPALPTDGTTAAALPEGRAGSPGGEEEAQARTSLLVRRRMPIVSAVL